MKSVYETANALDAHMILNLLEQEGIAGRVDGEYLPGGVGELQAINLVRVMVDEPDVERARQVIRDWESIPVEDTPGAAARRPGGRGGGITGFITGLVIGGGVVFWAYNTPLTGQDIDVNGDGLPDERQYFRDGRISRTEVDRNFDGKADAVHRYDHRGMPSESRLDDNFDGIFETRLEYRHGQPDIRTSDLNQDGTTDLRAAYRHGVLDEVLILGEGGDRRKKRTRYHLGKRIAADFDWDGDGSYDVEYTYDYFEQTR